LTENIIFVGASNSNAKYSGFPIFTVPEYSSRDTPES